MQKYDNEEVLVEKQQAEIEPIVEERIREKVEEEEEEEEEEKAEEPNLDLTTHEAAPEQQEEEDWGAWE